MGDIPDVQIPGKAVSDARDVRQPVRTLLEQLNLLGTAEHNEQATGRGSVFAGPPQSVALIEAGATAAAKWWAAGLGATVIATWVAVAAWWEKQDETIQAVAVGGAALATAALVVAIGYLIASDIRARAVAAVSTIEARAQIATIMIEATQAVYEATPDAAQVEIIPLAGKVRAKNLGRPAADEEGWLAVAMERHADGAIKYILVKGSAEATVSAAELEFYS